MDTSSRRCRFNAGQHMDCTRDAEEGSEFCRWHGSRAAGLYKRIVIGVVVVLAIVVAVIIFYGSADDSVQTNGVPSVGFDNSEFSAGWDNVMNIYETDPTSAYVACDVVIKAIDNSGGTFDAYTELYRRNDGVMEMTYEYFGGTELACRYIMGR